MAVQHPQIRFLTILVLVISGALGIVIIFSTQRASAQGNFKVYLPLVMKDFQSPPPPTLSYYVQSPSTLSNLGTQVGQLVVTQGITDHVVILDFGDPGSQNNTYGYYMVGGGYVDVASASTAVQQFALSWIQATLNTPHILTIVMGGNNHGGAVTTGHASAWSGAVAFAKINVTNSRVRFVGGIDAEQEWSTAATVRAWAEAFRDGFSPHCTASAGTGACLYNFGTSICGYSSTNEYCGFSDWDKYDIWYLSAGLQKTGQSYPFAAAFPEIYNTVGSNGRQWASVSLYGAINQGRKLYFVGSLAQRAACEQFLQVYGYYPASCNGTDNTPEQAFSNLRDKINADNRTSQVPIPWSSNIKYQVSP